MALIDVAIRVQGKGNDIRKKLNLRGTERCILLEGGLESGRLRPVIELESGWFTYFHDYRAQMVLKYSTTSTEFANQIARSSFVAYGTPNSQGFIDVYMIDPEQRDVIPPSTQNAFWKVYMTRVAKRRYQITEESSSSSSSSSG